MIQVRNATGIGTGSSPNIIGILSKPKLPHNTRESRPILYRSRVSRVLEITHRHTFTFTQTLHTVPGVSLPPVLFLPELNNSFLVPGNFL